jgi:hypothetical protein
LMRTVIAEIWPKLNGNTGMSWRQSCNKFC